MCDKLNLFVTSNNFIIESSDNLISYNEKYHNQILEHDINVTKIIIKSTYDTINTILNPQVKTEPKPKKKRKSINKWMPTDELYTIAESIDE
jgi:hypothetical protein